MTPCAVCCSAQRRWLGIASEIKGGVPSSGAAQPRLATFIQDVVSGSVGSMSADTRAAIRNMRRAAIDLVDGKITDYFRDYFGSAFGCSKGAGAGGGGRNSYWLYHLCD